MPLQPTDNREALSNVHYPYIRYYQHRIRGRILEREKRRAIGRRERTNPNIRLGLHIFHMLDAYHHIHNQDRIGVSFGTGAISFTVTSCSIPA